MVAVLPHSGMLPNNSPLPHAKCSPKLLDRPRLLLHQPCVRAGAVSGKIASSETPSALTKIDPLVWRGIISSTGDAEAGLCWGATRLGIAGGNSSRCIEADVRSHAGLNRYRKGNCDINIAIDFQIPRKTHFVTHLQPYLGSSRCRHPHQCRQQRFQPLTTDPIRGLPRLSPQSLARRLTVTRRPGRGPTVRGMPSGGRYA